MGASGDAARLAETLADPRVRAREMIVDMELL
jgi:hypothetical protein